MTSPLRRPLIAANWKMHLSLAESAALAKAVKDGCGDNALAEVVLCVPFTALAAVSQILKGGSVALGAQNLHWEAQGAFTGEISGAQIVDAGGAWVIVGHSERRQLFGETNETVRRKIAAALACGLKPIVCIGETLAQREGQQTFRVLKTQIEEGLAGLAPTQLGKLTVAYEPIWAIGTGKTATPEQAQEAHLFIRKTIGSLFGEGAAAGLRILYGGSVKAENIDALMAQPDLDGALVGGESLKPISFLRVVHFRNAAKVG